MMRCLQRIILMFSLASHATAGFISRSLSNCDVAVYQKTNDGTRVRKTIMKNGTYIIQGIVPLTTTGTNCSIIKENGLVSVMSLQFAIEKSRASSAFFAGREFGYQIEDSCNSIPTVMAIAIETVSQFRNESVCRTRTCSDESASVKPVTAIVGPYQSFTSIPFASLLGLFKIPIVSPSASSRLLSKKDLYKSFFRIIPSDVVQAKVIAELLKRFGWNYVFAIGSDDNYGKLGISILKDYREEFEFCIVADEYIPYMTDDMEEKASEIVQELLNADKAKVVVFFGYNEQIELILAKAEEKKLNRVWLMSDAFTLTGYGTLNVTKNMLTGILKVSPKSNKIKELQQFIEREIETNSHCNIFLKMFMQQQFGCEFNKSSIYCPYDTVKSMTEQLTDQETSLFGNTIDAFNAIATATEQLLIDKCSNNKGKLTCPPGFSINPQDLTEYIFRVNISNVHGDRFQFDNQGDPAYPFYDIGNVQWVQDRFQMVKVGQWDPLSNLKIEIGKVFWPTWANNIIPISKCSDDCMEGHYVSARTECCWSCEICLPNTISVIKNAENCSVCQSGYVSNAERTECVKYIYTYLRVEDLAGILIMVVNILGVVVCMLVIAAYWALKDSNVIRISMRMAHIEHCSILQLILSFVYGTILLINRDSIYCNIAVGGMYLLKSGFAVLILSRTRLYTAFIQKHIAVTVGISLQTCHFVSMIALMIVHFTLTIVCCVMDPIQLQEQPMKSERILALDCTFDYTAMQAVTLLVYPHVLLLVATIIAVRERRNKHAYSQSKFVNFVAIAHCIVSVAFFPTYKYVVGIYRTIVMAFKMDVCAFTYVGCLILPQIYVAYTENTKISSPREERTTDVSMAAFHKDSRAQESPSEPVETTAQS